jgi:hypothetical protein
MKLAGFLLLLLVLLSGGCTFFEPENETQVETAKRFEEFPLYWVGESFEDLELQAIQLGPAEFVTLIYGECTPKGENHPTCVPPLQIQIMPLCLHLGFATSAPRWKERQIRGAPVGVVDSAPVLFTAATQVKVYRGERSDAGLPMRALRALRSLNDVEPVIGPDDTIPAPDVAVLTGAKPCQ